MSLRDAIKESSNLGAIVTAPSSDRPILFYAEDSFTWVQFEGYVEALLDRAIPVIYVTSQKDDPVLLREIDGLTSYYISRQLPQLFKRLRSTVVVLTMPDLGSFHIPKPDECEVVYIFHSLNSAHTSYRSGAFDFYDHFFCTGPHHIQEIETVRSLRRASPATLHEVGYYKLDRISEVSQSTPRHTSQEPEVLLAPSWAPSNILEAHGKEVIRSILGQGLRVTVRPHPQFFHSLYPSGVDIIRSLQAEFANPEEVIFELSIDTEESFHRCELMVSDWSGAAFEFALGTHRPVIFIDTPQKLFNTDWELVGLPAFEEEVRSRLGQVVDSQDVENVGALANTMIRQDLLQAEELSAIWQDLVFNPGNAATVGADILARLVDNA